MAAYHRVEADCLYTGISSGLKWVWKHFLPFLLVVDQDYIRSVKVWSTGAAWRSGNSVGRINKVTLRRAWLLLGWVTCKGSTTGGGTLFLVCNQPRRSTQPFILLRSINWVVSCNRMFASSHEWRRLVNAYGVKAWCGWLEQWCVC